MKASIHSLLCVGLLLIVPACSSSTVQDDPNPIGTVVTPGNGTTNSSSAALGKGQPGTVGLAGIDAWDKLPSTEKNRISQWNTLFLHQSVGQDLEEGAKANGYPFDYFGPADVADKGMRGGIFVDVGGIANGNPFDKIRVFKECALRSKDVLQIAVFKFGYADIKNENQEQVKVAYKAFIDELRAQIKGLRFMHITPPLVHSADPSEGNLAKINIGQWMKTTFSNTDVIFDLQEIETNNGVCQQNNTPLICADNRASTTDPSDVNGVDSSDGQGHLGKKAGQRISKAFLMSLYNTGK